jgi:hypothetical protein
MMRNIRRKLSVMQFILVAVSFFMAISTSMMGGSFGFILWYAVLGGVTFLFYRDVRFVLLVAFVPIFLWLFADTMHGWWQGGAEGAARDTGFFRFVLTALGGSLLGAGLHTLFAFVGLAVVWLAARKKTLPAVLAVLLSLGVLLVYDAYNGNPVNKWLAAQKLRTYLAETYPDEEFRIRDGFYNFKSSAYEFRVVPVGSVAEDGKAAEYRFAVRAWMPRVVLDGIYMDRLDEETMERLGAEAAAEMTALLEPKVPALRDVRVYLEVQKGELPNDAVWHKDLPVADELRIEVVLDAGVLTEEEVREAARRIQAALDEAGYRYRSVVLNANAFSGGELGPLKYAVSFKPGDDLTNITIRKFNQD